MKIFKKTAALILSIALIIVSVPISANVIAETASGSCGDNLTWSLSGGVLTISGTGDMNDYQEPYSCGCGDIGWYNQPLWYQYAVTEVVIEAGVTSIGAYAFNSSDYSFDLSEMYCFGHTETEEEFFGCPNCLEEFGCDCTFTSPTVNGDLFTYTTGMNITSVTIPASVTSIGENAFLSCENLTIKGYAGSYAQTYASESGYTFTAIDEENDITVAGDINGDGVLDAEDVTALENILIGSAEATEAADVNADGIIDTRDYVRLKKLLAADTPPESETGVSAVFTVDNVEIPSGTDSVSLNVTVENNPGIAAARLQIGFDASALEYAGIENGSVFGNCTIISQSDNIVTVILDNELDSDILSGTVLTVNFNVIAQTGGSYAVTVTEAECVNWSEEFIEVQTVLGGVNIVCTSHTYGEWTTVTEPTCGTAGSKVHTCTVCGEEETETIAATGAHSYEIETAGTPGCSYPTSVNYYCSLCGEYGGYGSVVLLEHDGQNIWRIVTDASGVTYAVNSCTRCGTELAREVYSSEYTDRAVWSFDEASGMLTVGGFGSIGSYEAPAKGYDWEDATDALWLADTHKSPWFDLAVKNVVIEEGITEIGAYSFDSSVWTFSNGYLEGMVGYKSITVKASYQLESITIPASVTSIGENAFKDCENLTIKGYTGSYAETYASENGYTFEVLDGIEAYLTYTVSDGKATITACDTSVSGDIVIPDTLGGYTVAGIGSNAFKHCIKITSITIPEAITSVGTNVFAGCTGLAEINADQSNTAYSSENGVLFNKAKTVLVCYPIGKSDTSYVIPESVTEIGNYAFSSCKKLTGVIISENVEKIGTAAFSGCTNITEIALPDSVTSISSAVFNYCTKLESITVGNGNTAYSSENGILFDKEKTVLVCYPAGKSETTYSIPESVEAIGKYAFYNNAVLKSITVPGNVSCIDDFAFSYCKGITTVNIEYGVDIIEGQAFANCTELTSIYIPCSITTIEKSAFKNCTGLATVYYYGSSAEWGAISIEDGNDYLTSAEICYHEHSGDWVITVPVTCTTDGEKYRICDCGYEETVVISAIGHAYTEIIISPTCTGMGYTVYLCDDCGYSYNTDFVDIIPHNYSAVVTAPTCTENGYTAYTCEVCGDSYIADETNAIGHNYSSVVTAPTCTQNGFTTYTCENCGDAYADSYTNAFGHSYAASLVLPTINSRGYTLHTCETCGDTYKDNYTDYADSPKIVVSDTVVGRGKTVKLTVSVSENPGIAAFVLGLDYDKTALTLQNIEVSEELGGMSTVSEKVVWFANSDVSFEGELLTLTFTVAEDAQLGNYGVTVTYEPGDISNRNEEDISFAVTAGTVTVADHIAGDINGDGVTNSKDLTRLSKHLAEIDGITVNEAALDVSNDGVVNNKDLVLLMRYLSGEQIAIY